MERAAHPFLTPEQNVALDMIFACLGEERINRTMLEYQMIAARAPNLKTLHAQVNRRLRTMTSRGHAPYKISTFKGSNPGRDADRHYQERDYPNWLSIETVRLAWVKSGMRALRRLKKLSH